MADEIAKIGLDTTDISRALDRISGQLDKTLGGAAKKADKEVNTLSRSLKAMGKAAVAFFGFQSIRNGIQSLTRLNADIDATRSKLVRGSDEAREFEDAVAGIGSNQANAFHKAERLLDNLSLKMKAFAAKSLLGLGMMGGLVKPEDVFKGDTGPKGNTKILEQEDKIAAFQESRTASEESRIKLMEMEGELLLRQLEYYRRAENMDAKKINSLKAQLTQNAFETNAARTAFDLSEKAARATSDNLRFERMGYAHIGEEQKIIADYEERITVARREGRKELAEQLTVQRDIAVQDAKVARARETPETRREARKEQRLRDRDLGRDDARQKEFARRTKAGAVGQKGSPLAEFQMGVQPVAGGAGGTDNAGIISRLDVIAKNTAGSLSVSASK